MRLNWAITQQTICWTMKFRPTKETTGRSTFSQCVCTMALTSHVRTNFLRSHIFTGNIHYIAYFLHFPYRCFFAIRHIALILIKRNGNLKIVDRVRTEATPVQAWSSSKSNSFHIRNKGPCSKSNWEPVQTFHAPNVPFWWHFHGLFPDVFFLHKFN